MPGEEPDDDDRDVHEEDRAPVEVLEQEAAGERPEHAAEAGGRRPRRRSPCPAPSAGNTLVMIDSVAGMMNAPPMPMNARVAISCSDVLANADASEPSPKITRPSCSAPRRPKRSPRLPAGEQQAREHERVRVDHPLQLAVGGVEVAHDRGDRDVEDRVVEHDHEQAEAEDGEDPPPPLVGAVLRVGRSGCWSCGALAESNGPFRM